MNVTGYDAYIKLIEITFCAQMLTKNATFLQYFQCFARSGEPPVLFPRDSTLQVNNGGCLGSIHVTLLDILSLRNTTFGAGKSCVTQIHVIEILL